MKMNWGAGIIIVFVFILFAFGMATMVFIAMNSGVNLVADDYYQQEVEFQDRIESTKNAQNIEKLITLSFDTEQQMIELQFPENMNFQQGNIHFFRPSNYRLDKKIELNLDQENKQTIPFTLLNETGLWRVKIEWKEGEKGFFVEKSLVID